MYSKKISLIMIDN